MREAGSTPTGGRISLVPKPPRERYSLVLQPLQPPPTCYNHILKEYGSLMFLGDTGLKRRISALLRAGGVTL